MRLVVWVIIGVFDALTIEIVAVLILLELGQGERPGVQEPGCVNRGCRLVCRYIQGSIPEHVRYSL